MFEILSSEHPLATAQDLATYHARRERFYATTAMLLSAPPDRLLLGSARRILRVGTRTTGELAAALTDDRRWGAEAEHERLFGAAPIVDLRCRDPHARVRSDLSADATIALPPDVPAELRALAVLADRTAGAIEAGDISEAATLCELQAR